MDHKLSFCTVTEGLDGKILSCFAEKNIDCGSLIVRDGYFIGLDSILRVHGYKKMITDSGMEFLFSPQMIHDVAQPYEGLSQLVVGRVESLREITSCMLQIGGYVSIFLKVLFQSYYEFLSNLMVHFANRQIENRPLIQNSYIRLEISECMAILETIKITSENFALIDRLNLLTNLDRLVFLGRKCTKLLGGMSQLKGSVLELYLVTMLVINTYCSEALP